MKKLIVPFFIISGYTPMLWFINVFKTEIVGDSIPHILIGAFLAVFPMYSWMNSNIKVNE
jgi:hypothetical protein